MRKHDLLIGAALVTLTLAVYLQTIGFGFVSLDDPRYVSGNPHVLSGLGMDGVVWAFTSFDDANWHPLTWLSLMLDATRAGARPGPYHAVNVALHVANSLLLFVVLAEASGSRFRSGFVAALFALHPLHVESVAWITERKDVLSTLFWMLALLAYLRYARSPGPGRYALVVAAFAAGLMAKPMLVTLPLVLLLLDHWPLRRWTERRRRSKLLWEKLPLLGMSAIVAAITMLAQSRGGALGDLETLPWGARLSNAVVSYAVYLRDMFWPANLAVLYPHPRGGLPVWQTGLAAIVLVVVSVICVLLRRRAPYMGVGWSWYLVTLLPVIGLVQVGVQARADRYTYVPLIGPFLMLAWGVPALVGPGRRRRAVLGAAAVLVVMACAVTTYRQVGVWRDSVTLYRHALQVDEQNARAHNGLGMALEDRGDAQDALASFRRAVEIDPGYAEARANLAASLARAGETDEAEAEFQDALRRRPDDATARANYGTVLLRQGRTDEAIEQLTEAIRLDPRNVSALNNLGVIRLRRGQLEQARELFAEVLRIAPHSEGARRNLDRVERQLDRRDDPTK